MTEHYHVVYTFVNSEEAHSFRDMVHKLLGNPLPFLKGEIKICKGVEHK